jgi:uncharacterized membrane protein HdeD (DUF308 family)
VESESSKNRPWWRISRTARTSAWLGAINLLMGTGWLVTGPIASYRTYWLPFAIGPFLLVTGLMYITAAIMHGRAERRK